MLTGGGGGSQLGALTILEQQGQPTETSETTRLGIRIHHVDVDDSPLPYVDDDTGGSGDPPETKKAYPAWRPRSRTQREAG